MVQEGSRGQYFAASCIPQALSSVAGTSADPLSADAQSRRDSFCGLLSAQSTLF